MTHRLEIRNENDTVTYEFHGLLDDAAVATLRAALAQARGRGAEVRVVLRAGSEVERTCLPALRALDAVVVAESPYLARWIARDA